MKIAASIFSWIGGTITTIFAFVYLSQGYTATRCYYSYYGYSNCYPEQVPYPAWLWVLCIVFAILRLILLIWRQYSVSQGKKVACGVLTLIFASVIGGILTLCIPEYQLYGYAPVKRSTPYQSSNLPKPAATPLERASKISVYEEQLNKGIITRTEYDRKVAALDGKTVPVSTAPKKPSEDEKIELLQKYKKLLDDGVITQEEFDKKKEDLLK